MSITNFVDVLSHFELIGNFQEQALSKQTLENLFSTKLGFTLINKNEYLSMIRYLIEAKKIDISPNNYGQYFWESCSKEFISELYQENLIPHNIKTFFETCKIL